MKKETFIDFTKLDYSDSAPFNETEVVHLDEFKNAISLIKKNLDHIEQPPNNRGEVKRLHNTMSILGSRGSGKTSFLMSIRNKINVASEFERIHFLDIIDPTLIETKEHIFVNIVARVEKLTKEYIKFQRSQFSTQNSTDIYHEWEKSLSDLSGSIPCIDGVGKHNLYDEWEDSDYILEQGLKRAKAANSLEANFNRFIFKSLEILNKKCLVIAFDDVDTDFTKGWEILECIRKYLTSPIILPIISGDISLYSFLVRKRQWSNLDKNIMEMEDKKAYYLQMVDHLESQYMLKVLKPENRITLTSLYEKVSRGENDIYIKFKDGENNDKKIEIRHIYSDIIQEIGIRHDISNISALLLTYPIRTQIRLIKTWVNTRDNELEFVPSLLNVFWSDIAAHYNHPDEFNKESILNTIPLLGLLYQNKKIQEAGRFLPFTDNSSLNSALLAVGANFNNTVKTKSHLIFDYWVRIGSLMNLTQGIGYTDKENRPSIKGLIEYTQLLSDIGTRKQSSLIASYLCATKILDSGDRSIQSHRELISLYSFKSKKKPKLNDNIFRLDESLKNKDFLSKCIGYLPLIGIRHESSLNPIYSISILLASIAELLQERHKIDKFKERNNEEKDEDSKEHMGFSFIQLQRLSQFREFVLPQFLDAAKKRPTFIDEDNEGEDSELTNSPNTENIIELTKPFLNDLERWFRNYPGEASIHVLGRVATRFYASVQRIPKTNSLGEVFNRQLILFLNSVLVEDAIENGLFIPDFNNPINSNQIFLNNFTSCFAAKNHYSGKDILKFSRWMISCPLFHCYLDSEVKKAIIRGLPDNSLYKNNTSIHAILSEVSIRKTESKREEKTDIQVMMDAQKANLDQTINLSQRLHEYQLKETSNLFKQIFKEQKEQNHEQNIAIMRMLEHLIAKER